MHHIPFQNGNETKTICHVCLLYVPSILRNILYSLLSLSLPLPPAEDGIQHTIAGTLVGRTRTFLHEGGHKGGTVLEEGKDESTEDPVGRGTETITVVEGVVVAVEEGQTTTGVTMGTTGEGGDSVATTMAKRGVCMWVVNA